MAAPVSQAGVRGFGFSASLAVFGAACVSPRFLRQNANGIHRLLDGTPGLGNQVVGQFDCGIARFGSRSCHGTRILTRWPALTP
ncbi:MAG TPA: hypothetical protein VGD36_15160, partial [Xanthobacteraceae bacterium]